MQGVVGILGRLEAVGATIATARAALGHDSLRRMVAPLTNNISTRQNELSQIQLLQAQRFLYAKAKRLIILQLWLVISVAVAGAIAAFFAPESSIKIVVAAVAVLISLVDVTLLDPQQKRTITDAAKVQEAFDCAVLDLPWDHVVAGDPVIRETISEASNAYSQKFADAGLRDWYPVESARVPMHFGRLVCQRSALAYDSALRRRYAAVLLALPCVLFAIQLLAGLLNELTLKTFVVSVALPFMPVAIWTLREHRRQTEAADTNDTLHGRIDALWNRMAKGECDAVRGSAEARTIQSELFRGRKSKTPIMGWVYNAMRGGLERRMRAVANDLVAALEPIIPKVDAEQAKEAR